MQDLILHKMILGFSLIVGGVLLFSIWKDKLAATPEDERSHFLMYQWLGGAWIVAVFSACGGAYFIADSIMRLTTLA